MKSSQYIMFRSKEIVCELSYLELRILSYFSMKKYFVALISSHKIFFIIHMKILAYCQGVYSFCHIVHSFILLCIMTFINFYVKVLR